MWLRDGNVWHWDTVPELEVRPCLMEGGNAWWVCWFADTTKRPSGARGGAGLVRG